MKSHFVEQMPQLRSIYVVETVQTDWFPLLDACTELPDFFISFCVPFLTSYLSCVSVNLVS